MAAKTKFISGLTGACMLVASCHAWSWGHTGHVEISRIAIEKLPDETPLFVRNGLSAFAIGELGPEADESKTTGIVTGVSSAGSILTKNFIDFRKVAEQVRPYTD